MALLDELDSTPGADTFPDMYTKINDAIQVINSILGGGADGEAIRKSSATDFDFEFYTPFSSDIKFKEVSIGAWDVTSSLTISVAHGLTFSKIKGIVSVSIVNDALNNVSPITRPQGATFQPSGRYEYDGTNVDLEVRSGGFFDDSPYAGTVSSRGTIIIAYID